MTIYFTCENLDALDFLSILAVEIVMMLNTWKGGDCIGGWRKFVLMPLVDLTPCYLNLGFKISFEVLVVESYLFIFSTL